MKEGGQKLFFGISSVGKPLDQMPKALAVKGAADEIQAGIIWDKEPEWRKCLKLWGEN